MHIDVHLCMHICTHMPRQKWALMHYMLLVYILSGWCILVAVVLKMPGSFNQYKKVVISVDLMICNLFPRYYWLFIFLSAIPVHSYYWCSFRCLWEASCYATLHGRYDIFRMKKRNLQTRDFLSSIILSFDLSLFVDCYEYLQSMDSWERQQTYSMLCTFVIFNFIMFYSKLKVEWWDLVALNFVLMFINFVL